MKKKNKNQIPVGRYCDFCTERATGKIGYLYYCHDHKSRAEVEWTTVKYQAPVMASWYENGQKQ